MMKLDDHPDHEYTTVYCCGCGESYQILKLCSFRFCPICKVVRGVKVRRRLSYIFDHYPPLPGMNLKMITLSVKNTADLPAGLRHLIASFRRLRQRKLWKKFVAGGATFIEITGKKGDYHPHLHILCYSRYMPFKILLRMWMGVSGGSACWIQQIPKSTALYYVLKYLTKLDMPLEEQIYVSDQIKRFRLFQRFGAWHDFVIPVSKFDVPCEKCGCIQYLSSWEVDSAFRRSRTG